MAIAQRNHVGGDESQVLGEERQPAELLSDLVEQFIAGTVHPTPFDGRRFAGRNLPELREAAEMVEPDKVAGLCGPTQPLHPPAVSFAANGLPVVERIAPALARGAEVIGRHTGNHLGLQIVVSKAKQVTVRPDIGAVVIDENGDIPHNAN